MSDTELTHDRSLLKATGKTDELSPLVRRLIAPNPSPFTFTGTCSYIIGRGRVAIVDPGPENEEHLAAMLAAIEGETLDSIVITHTHRDHSPGARALQAATGARIIGCAPHVEIRNDASGRLDASHDMDYAPDEVMSDGDFHAGAGFTLEAIHTPGHASNHLCFAILEDNALLCGDHVMAWSTTIVSPPDGVMREYMASLEKLGQRDEAIFYPGHGAPVTDPRRYMRALAHHRRMREAAILREIGKNALPIPVLVDRIYLGLDEKLKKAAALSVLAHMEDLVARDLINAGGAATLEAVYSAR
jgi:glyoxylase-like metal-dependent hydrolase (beta-lactamase superfamily II)